MITYLAMVYDQWIAYSGVNFEQIAVPLKADRTTAQ